LDELSFSWHEKSRPINKERTKMVVKTDIKYQEKSSV
jgi:hypothetical protein